MSKEIYSAQIALYTTGGDGGGILNAYAASQVWDQNSLTWQRIEKDTTVIGSAVCYDDGDRYMIPITDQVQKILNGQAENNGFIIGFQNSVPFYHPDNELPTREGKSTADFQCDSLTLYKPGLTFAGGDVTVYNRQVYQCANDANSVFCNLAGYEPGSVGGAAAWSVIGDCIPRSVNLYSSDAVDSRFHPELVIHVNSTNSPVFNKVYGNTEKFVVAADGFLLFEKSYLGYKMSVRNMRGQVVLSQKIGSTKIVLASLPNGMYVADIRRGETKECFRLLVSKE